MQISSNSRPFNTTRTPVTHASHALVAAVTEVVLTSEPPRRRGRKAGDLVRFEATVAALTADLAHRVIQTCGHGWLKVPRSDRVLARAGDPILTSKLPNILDVMQTAGLIDQQVGLGSANLRQQTRIRAADRFVTALEAHAVTYGDLRAAPIQPEDMIRLKTKAEPGDRRGATKRRVVLPNSLEIARLQTEMIEINAAFHKANIAVDPHHMIAEGHEEPDVAERSAYRVFSGDLQHGGRLFGPFWLGMSSADRLTAISIDGEPIAALDYGQMALRILYASQGAVLPDGDLYDIPGLSLVYRKGVKRLVNALISTDKPLTRWPAGIKKEFPRNTKLDYALKLIGDHHRPIAQAFCRGGWGEVQRAESDIIVSVVLQCSRQGFAALPIHDCVIVPRSCAEKAKEVMQGEFMKRMKTGSIIEVHVEKDQAYPPPRSLAA